MFSHVCPMPRCCLCDEKSEEGELKFTDHVTQPYFYFEEEELKLPDLPLANTGYFVVKSQALTLPGIGIVEYRLRKQGVTVNKIEVFYIQTENTNDELKKSLGIFVSENKNYFYFKTRWDD